METVHEINTLIEIQREEPIQYPNLEGKLITFEVLQYDSGFTAMSSGVRVPSEFAVQLPLAEVFVLKAQPLLHTLLPLDLPFIFTCPDGPEVRC